MRTGRVLAYVWAAPATLLGLLFAALALRGGRLAIKDRVLEAQPDDHSVISAGS